MSLFSRVLIALLKPIMLGVVVAALLLLFFPEFRQGEGLNLNLFKTSENIPPRVSYYSALERSAPAVVNIYSISLDNGNRLFRNRLNERTSLGSGVIMTEDGYLLTCYHVIQNADSIYVALQDSRLLQAQLVGFDEITDLAVLRVFAEDLHVIPQMESPDLRVGDVVMAVGNPFDLGQTITSGVVSRTGQNGFANFFDFIQTDAVLNQGNSGGALVDSNGYLMGITNANFKTLDNRRRVTSVDGVNFAVPYTLARRVMDEIILNGKVTRGQLGFSGSELRSSQGIVVDSVSRNGPAATAGLQVNDIVLSINGIQVESAAKTLDMIAETEPGSEIVLTVSRDDRMITMTVIVGELIPQMVVRS
ncbi:trypsin-like peptidase domain-containing protein [Glaciecola sp. XM2]|jgi:serine protease DegS|uniref:trypsin-like peptidase domain-containing protein n=1 Tax=Glaciecola sp. XM2 TaxID=1914931 RepID=UPI001BDEC342|nr:trypsin-like peptidase domain-containing protein [Glaciecola sp. XM2]MBT1452472.1 trypsin-like peptidase domain-containing protein [Glaciecola sp. XM2]